MEDPAYFEGCYQASRPNAQGQLHEDNTKPDNKLQSGTIFTFTGSRAYLSDLSCNQKECWFAKHLSLLGLGTQTPMITILKANIQIVVFNPAVIISYNASVGIRKQSALRGVAKSLKAVVHSAKSGISKCFSQHAGSVCESNEPWVRVTHSPINEKSTNLQLLLAHNFFLETFDCIDTSIKTLDALENGSEAPFSNFRNVLEVLMKTRSSRWLI